MKRSVGLGLIAVFANSVWAERPFDRIQNIRDLAFVGAGYKSKAICSGILNEGKTQRLVEKEDLQAADPRLRTIPVLFNPIRREAVARVILPRVIERRSRFLDARLGCVVVDDEAVNYRVTYNGSYAGEAFRPFSWVSHRPATIGRIDEAFSPAAVERGQRTEAVVIVQNGQIIYERYREGTSQAQALQGWSMSKSITSALVGRAEQRGMLRAQRAPLAREWNLGDARSRIGFTELLTMTAGLKFDENYDNPLSDVNLMLFSAPDMAAYAASQDLEATPGTVFKYASGSTNIAARALRSLFANHQEYLNFPHRELFAKLGMRSAVFEVDRSGTYVGSSGAYASARDWAKFGQLYLQEGRWNGETLLNPQWVRFSRTPVSVSSKGEYGAGFWTNGFISLNQQARPWPNLPADAYAAIGYLGQMVLIIPSENLVAVRLGSDAFEGAWTPQTFGEYFF